MSSVEPPSSAKATEGKPVRPRRKRRFLVVKILAALFLATVALLFGALLSIDWLCAVNPPKLDGVPAILSVPVSESDGVLALRSRAPGAEGRRIGASWLARRDNIYCMYLAGDPFTLGYSNAALTSSLIEIQERSLIDLVNQKVPSATTRWLLLKYVKVRNRQLPMYVRREYQLEAYGLSRAYPDHFPWIGPVYMRLLNYHAAHDISHAVMDTPLIGCTSFAAWGRSTPDGRLMVGRNFDFDAGRAFDVNKIVMRVKPDVGLGYISVAWPGMIGVVSGINDARIAVTINASQSLDKRQIGTPVSFVLREVLQRASTLDEAIEIIRASQVFVNDSYLVADGKSGAAVVVEKTPLRTAVRRAGAEEFIICSNHFLSDELKSDPVNTAYMAEGTSVYRYDRMEALVRENAGKLTPEVIAGMLRDRQVPGNVMAGFGNAAAINTLSATHSVIIDATDGVIWVSAGPHQIGPYVPFSAADFDSPTSLAASEKRIIPPDPILADGSYDRHWRCRVLLEQADPLMKRKKWAEADKLIRDAAQLNPDFYLPPLMLGKIAVARKQWSEAKTFLTQAQEHFPAYSSERAYIAHQLELIAGGAR